MRFLLFCWGVEMEGDESGEGESADGAGVGGSFQIAMR
jgi:hypothetical protein